ncbi:EAL domain-containing protein [Parvularcula sp. IMCC14364]|uniref:EAL domain-containing protein n=1 Tax=Parvularcula sp. IMCC14364 TaxID=3067902 RepID=UPI0027417B08|nr:EAL domain-containing protein [Parvularcula sp. IMCC14364]
MTDIRIAEKNETLNLALEVAGQAMFEFDPVKNDLSWSGQETLASFLGVDKNLDLANFERLSSLIAPDDVMVRERAVQEAKTTDQGYAVEYRVKSVDGEWRWFEERGSWLNFGGHSRLIGVLRTIHEQKSREDHLSWLVTYDELTGQLNRQRTKELLDQHVRMEQGGAYIMVGIDNLGAVNSDFGFDIADEVIVETSNRLRDSLDDSDALGRVAGTKFGIILHKTDAEDIRSVCNKLLAAVRENLYETAKGGLAISVCAGVAPLTKEIASAEMAMAQAEAALDAARQIGSSSWSTFSEKTDTVSRRKRNSEMSDIILTALNERRIELAYQPIVTDINEEHTKYECLIRMMHNGEEVPPAKFIPIAEHLGLVHLLDRRALELATYALRKDPRILLNVNVSWETVKDPVWAEGYLAHLRANRDVSNRITVELTETQAVDALEASIEFVSEIKKVGCEFALDDFGAGYTSFRNLKALDIDVLKIDGSFVTGVCSSRDNQLFVRTLLDLARNFGMKTVAEWVDNDADAMLLKGLGVDYLQGFYIGRPVQRPEWSQNADRAEQASALRKA